MLTSTERDQIATILNRRANEIAMYRDSMRREKDIASVDYALELEVNRLRRLANRVCPDEVEGEASARDRGAAVVDDQIHSLEIDDESIDINDVRDALRKAGKLV